MLRRTALSIMEKGGVVRKMENLGEQELPYRMRAHAEWHTHGRYEFLQLLHDTLNPHNLTNPVSLFFSKMHNFFWHKRTHVHKRWHLLILNFILFFKSKYFNF